MLPSWLWQSRICLQCRRPRLISWSERSPREGNVNSHQHSCLENAMDKGAWQAPVHGVTKSQTWLSNTFTYSCIYFVEMIFWNEIVRYYWNCRHVELNITRLPSKEALKIMSIFNLWQSPFLHKIFSNTYYFFLYFVNFIDTH